MEYFRSSFSFDEGTYREISRFFMRRRYVWICWIIVGTLGVLTLFMVNGQMYSRAVSLLVLAVLLAPTPRNRRNRCWRSMTMGQKQLYPFGFTECVFTEGGIAIYGWAGNQCVVCYPSIRQAAETEHYIIICTRIGRYILVNKSCLTPEER